MPNNKSISNMVSGCIQNSPDIAVQNFHTIMEEKLSGIKNSLKSKVNFWESKKHIENFTAKHKSDADCEKYNYFKDGICMGCGAGYDKGDKCPYCHGIAYHKPGCDSPDIGGEGKKYMKESKVNFWENKEEKVECENCGKKVPESEIVSRYKGPGHHYNAYEELCKDCAGETPKKIYDDDLGESKVLRDLQEILENNSPKILQFENKTSKKVDISEATSIISVLSELNEEDRVQFIEKLEESVASFDKLLEFSLQETALIHSTQNSRIHNLMKEYGYIMDFQKSRMNPDHKVFVHDVTGNTIEVGPLDSYDSLKSRLSSQEKAKPQQ